jgi:hypothetical protein
MSNHPLSQSELLVAIHDERLYQDIKWGGAANDDHNTPRDWWAFITKYAAPALYNGASYHYQRSAWIKVAALALAALESLERKRSVES